MLKVAKENARPPALSDSPADTCFNNLKTKADIFTRNLSKFILKKLHKRLSSYPFKRGNTTFDYFVLTRLVCDLARCSEHYTKLLKPRIIDCFFPCP